MSMHSTLRAGRRRLARAGVAVAAVATFGALASGTASAAEPSTASAASSIFCWNEYDFTRTGNTVTASAYRDCTTYEVPQPLNVSIRKWYYDEFGNSGWVTVSSGRGVAKASCIPYWPTTYRHSITLEQIYC